MDFDVHALDGIALDQGCQLACGIDGRMNRPTTGIGLKAIAQDLPAIVVVHGWDAYRVVLNERALQPLVGIQQVRGGLKALGRELGGENAVHGRLASVKRLGHGAKRGC